MMKIEKLAKKANDNVGDNEKAREDKEDELEQKEEKSGESKDNMMKLLAKKKARLTEDFSDQLTCMALANPPRGGYM